MGQLTQRACSSRSTSSKMYYKWGHSNSITIKKTLRIPYISALAHALVLGCWMVRKKTRLRASSTPEHASSQLPQPRLAQVAKITSDKFVPKRYRIQQIPGVHVISIALRKFSSEIIWQCYPRRDWETTAGRDHQGAMNTATISFCTVPLRRFPAIKSWAVAVIFVISLHVTFEFSQSFQTVLLG